VELRRIPEAQPCSSSAYDSPSRVFEHRRTQLDCVHSDVTYEKPTPWDHGRFLYALDMPDAVGIHFRNRPRLYEGSPQLPDVLLAAAVHSGYEQPLLLEPRKALPRASSLVSLGALAAVGLILTKADHFIP